MINHLHKRLSDPNYPLTDAQEIELSYIIGARPKNRQLLSRTGCLETALWQIRLAFGAVTFKVLDKDRII